MYKFTAKIALILILTIYLSNDVLAQSRENYYFRDIYTGIETTAGKCEMIITTCFGNTFVLNSFGEAESRHLTVSVEYYNSLPNGGNGFSVTGGIWSLVVMRENQYAGTLYGIIENGSIVFPESNPGEKITAANLKVTGALGIFDGRQSKKISNYELKMTTDLESKKTVGMLDAIVRQSKNAGLPGESQ